MSTALELAALNRRLRELTPGTPEREAYLERLAAEIREGVYQPDPASLAEALLEELGTGNDGPSPAGSEEPEED